MRFEGSIEGALYEKVQSNQGDKGKKNFNGKEIVGSHFHWNNRGTKHDFPTCMHCGKKGYSPFKFWRRPHQQCEKYYKIGHH